jgi:hypothetical protein
VTVPATHQTAETQFVDAGGVRFAFRRFGAPGATPRVVLQHFRGNLQEPEQVAADVNSFLASPTTAS